MRAHKKTVEIQHRGALRAVHIKIHHRGRGFVLSGDGEVLAVPTLAERQVAVAHDRRRREVALHHKVVRHVDDAPRRVVCAGRAMRIAAAAARRGRARRLWRRAPAGLPTQRGAAVEVRGPDPAGGGGVAGAVCAPLPHRAAVIRAAGVLASVSIARVGDLCQPKALLVGHVHGEGCFGVRARRS
jgi:hypothetical protein